jgi:hypothetical protein
MQSNFDSEKKNVENLKIEVIQSQEKGKQENRKLELIISELSKNLIEIED